MIERIVLLKLESDHRSADAVRRIIDESRRVLPTLPGVVSAHVGRAADDRTESSWDVSLVVRFNTLKDIPPYAQHADHRTYVDDFLKPRVESIVAFNFELD